ncbi:MAG: tRNA lysidine(34) synthetase TilS [Dysgonamonadaceae bacterium]|jgi:tRNA(Ile)-lysidine synthase|nr:tRNA lysidine(34) synthetase TilS [Dysgonamonadaceae bacterium]
MGRRQAMIRKVRQFIEAQRLLSGNEKLIVGVSGGADSVVLLSVLQCLGYDCVAAHCNFHLRGEESNRDEKLVFDFTQSLNIKLVKIDFNTVSEAKKRKISIEMAARDLRYEWFERLRNEYQADYIAVAHHQDDNIETVLLNLIRGTGLKGLTGIKPENGKIIRPLLCVSKQEILAFAQQKELPFVVDSSNLQDEFRRNKIRLNLLPALQTINPSFDKSLLQSVKYWNEAEKIYRNHIDAVVEQVFDKANGRINIQKLKNLPSPEAVLFEILKDYGFNSDQIEDIAQSIESQPGKMFFSGRYGLLRDRESFWLHEKDSTDGKDFKNEKGYEILISDAEIEKPVSLKLSFQNVDSGFEIIKNQNIATFDAGKLKFPLILRKWRTGDKFVPFGMNHFKKISDYFNDRKISRLEKQNIWLLCSGDDIIWIVGHRNDNRYRISAETRRAYTVSFRAQ